MSQAPHLPATSCNCRARSVVVSNLPQSVAMWRAGACNEQRAFLLPREGAVVAGNSQQLAGFSGQDSRMCRSLRICTQCAAGKCQPLLSLRGNGVDGCAAVIGYCSQGSMLLAQQSPCESADRSAGIQRAF